MTQRHPFHLVDPSPWPLYTAFSLLGLTTGIVMYFHGYIGGGYLLSLSLIIVLICMFSWFRDITREATFQGHHTRAVQKGLRLGMILFIASEVMFFFGFFWAFFHSSLVPTIEIGAIWPPKGILVLNPFEVPLVNTLILLLSGATVTWAHHAIVAGLYNQAVRALVATILLGLLFTGLQAFEYIEASFGLSDGIYGTTFYLATGFHGFHVIVGTIFLFVCCLRLCAKHFANDHHFGFEAAAWYWHFVDVVWLFLFVTIYWWGGM